MGLFASASPETRARREVVKLRRAGKLAQALEAQRQLCRSLHDAGEYRALIELAQEAGQPTVEVAARVQLFRMERAGAAEWLSLAAAAAAVGMTEERVEALFRAADRCAVRGECQRARDLCDELLRLEPSHRGAIRLRGVMAARLGPPPEEPPRLPRRDRLVAGLRRRRRSEALELVRSSPDFGDAARCLVEVLRHAREDRDLVEAGLSQVERVFRGGWVENRQLPSLLFCLRAAGHDWALGRLCRLAVDRATRTGDWFDVERGVEWLACSRPIATEAVLGLGNLAPIWGRLSTTARSRLMAWAPRPSPAVVEGVPEFDVSDSTPALDFENNISEAQSTARLRATTALATAETLPGIRAAAEFATDGCPTSRTMLPAMLE